LPVTVAHREHWSVLTLDRPPRNVLDVEMLGALVAALDGLAAAAPLLLIRSTGRHFSTGYDIADIPAAIFDPDPAVRAAHPFEQLMERLVDYPSPIVAAVQGDAYGGAVELLSCVDLRVAADTVRVGVPPVRLGLIYSHTGLRRMLRCFGSPLAREMLLTGEPVAAARAHAAGFFNRLAPTAELDAAADELMGQIALGGPGALRGTRRILNLLEEAETLDAAQLAEVARLRHASRSSDEFARAQAAFLARRPSPFKPETH
jgi:enoyl-CoA hydratase/carnithine racemase